MGRDRHPCERHCVGCTTEVELRLIYIRASRDVISRVHPHQTVAVAVVAGSDDGLEDSDLLLCNHRQKSTYPVPVEHTNVTQLRRADIDGGFILSKRDRLLQRIRHTCPLHTR